MKYFYKLACCLLLCIIFASCTLTRNIVMNSMSDTLAGADKNGIPPKKVDENSMMAVLTGEEDPRLMADFFPTALKLYEVMLAQNPKHQGIAIMTGSLYVMYANVFIQTEADMLPVTEYKFQASEQQRAKLHYLRGRDYVFQAFDLRYPGFSDALMSGDTALIDAALEQLTEDDVNATYWLGAGWLGAFAVDPLDTNQLKTLSGAIALLEKAVALNPDYSDGAIWDILTAFYATAPVDFGGNLERAMFASEEAFRVSGGKTPGPYVTYATSFSIPQQDLDGFIENLTMALAIDPDDNVNTRLATIITQQKAAWLLESVDDYFVIW